MIWGYNTGIWESLPQNSIVEEESREMMSGKEECEWAEKKMLGFEEMKMKL